MIVVKRLNSLKVCYQRNLLVRDDTLLTVSHGGTPAHGLREKEINCGVSGTGCTYSLRGGGGAGRRSVQARAGGSGADLAAVGPVPQHPFLESIGSRLLEQIDNRPLQREQRVAKSRARRLYKNDSDSSLNVRFSSTFPYREAMPARPRGDADQAGPGPLQLTEAARWTWKPPRNVVELCGARACSSRANRARRTRMPSAATATRT